MQRLWLSSIQLWNGMLTEDRLSGDLPTMRSYVRLCAAANQLPASGQCQWCSGQAAATAAYEGKVWKAPAVQVSPAAISGVQCLPFETPDHTFYAPSMFADIAGPGLRQQ